MEEFQSDLLDKGIKETVIRLNFRRLDPDYESTTTDREEAAKKEIDPTEIKIKQNNSAPNSIGSLKSVVKLFTQYEPDILAGLLVNVKGKKIPISQIIVPHEKAHELLWSGNALEQNMYFVYGTVEHVIRRAKDYYINFASSSNKKFSLVVFDKYFKYFTYPGEKLVGKNILAFGSLQKNTYNNINSTEMVIKANSFVEFLP